MAGRIMMERIITGLGKDLGLLDFGRDLELLDFGGFIPEALDPQRLCEDPPIGLDLHPDVGPLGQGDEQRIAGRVVGTGVGGGVGGGGVVGCGRVGCGDGRGGGVKVFGRARDTPLDDIDLEDLDFDPDMGPLLEVDEPHVGGSVVGIGVGGGVGCGGGVKTFGRARIPPLEWADLANGPADAQTSNATQLRMPKRATIS
jgi:hypothetical protein